MNNQENLRIEARKKLDEMNNEEMLQQSRQICAKLLKFIEEQNYKHVACFVPLQKTNTKEIDLTECIQQLLHRGVECYKPYIDKLTNKMFFIPLSKNGPTNFLKIIKNINLIICPGLVFNEKGHRIGRGKGYYDKTLAFCKTMNKKFITIGVGFDNQNLREIEWDLNDHDVSMDYVMFPM
jgi:5-formyltetrahydrofolate cyclo-ligase